MIGIVDYGAGNTASVINALKKLGVDFVLSRDKSQLDNCDKIIFPGVGEASSAMNNLNGSGLSGFLKDTKLPTLGICLGMQMMCDKSEEGETSCLEIISENVIKFDHNHTKVPHMGWSKVELLKENELFRNISNDTYFYFAHSYYLPLNQHSIASTKYLPEFSAAINVNNYYGVQFHPEKSGEAGLQLLKNFVNL